MYYSEIERLKKIEKYLELLAYGSVALDALVAFGSLLLMHGFHYADLIVSISNYAITAEIAIAAVLLATLLAMKHYKNIIYNFDINAFRMKQKRRMRFYKSARSSEPA
ncbi:MAG: hypothetical protein M1544_03225 [Candidatus Marsarchaeota archaeon]|nr:hypothetical protein [Candidatus Marsarchaeota archaeon]